MSYSLEELREKFNLSTDGEDRDYWGKNAHNGHYWATDPTTDEKVYLGHNDNLDSLLGNSQLEGAANSTNYNHDTDVARGFAGLLEGSKEEEPLNESPYDDDYEESEELAAAKTRVKAFQDDRMMGGPDSNFSGWINTYDSADEPTVAEGSGQSDATPGAQAFYDDYSGKLKDKMKKGSRDSFGDVDVWSADNMK